MVHRLERTTFETPRASEYFTADELRKQTTQPPEKFGSVVIKELIDNALDACEGAGVAPEVTIRTIEGAVEGHVRITVSDNGPGIPPEVVGKMLNFETRTSDKAAYRSPTRGAQGNALKTVVGIPHALGSSEPVAIEARGVRHVIKPMVDPAGNVRVAHEMQNSEGSAGTRVTVTLPQRFELKPVECKPNYWAAAVSLFNPHAFVKLEHFSESNNHGEREPDSLQFYKPTTEGFKKYVADDYGSPHWYGPKALEKLIGAYIGQVWSGEAEDLPLGTFVRRFKGLSSSAKAKRVSRFMGGTKHLSDFVGRGNRLDSTRVRFLLEQMQDETPAPSHKALGRVGKEHFEERFNEMRIVSRFNYKCVEGYLQSGLPYTFEFAVAEIDQSSGENDLFFGVNHSSTFGDPLEDVRFKGPKYAATGIEEFLDKGYAHPEFHTFDDPDGPETLVATHVITPAPLFMERGKTKLDIWGGK